MKVGIYDVRSGRSVKYIEVYKKILEFNNIDYQLYTYDSNFWEDIRKVNYYIHRFVGTDQDIYIANTILPIVENVRRIPCYPNKNTYWSYEDKIREYMLMYNHGYPMVRSYIFFNASDAINWIESRDRFPIIFKLKSGAGSSNVIKIKTKSQARKVVKRMFGRGVDDQGIPTGGNLKFLTGKNYIKHIGIKILCRLGLYTNWPVWQLHKNYALFQDFLHGNEFDTRVTTIGNRAFAFRRMNRKNDFRSSGSGLIDYDIKKIDLACVQLALNISAKLGFQSMSYDFLKDENDKPLFCEYSYTFRDTAIHDCPGYWDNDLNFVEGHFWPQYFLLSDLLNTTLIQPDL